MWKEKVLEDLDKRLQEYKTVEEFFKDIKKRFKKKEKVKSYRVEEDIWGELEKFCDKEEKKNELPKKQIAKRIGRSEF